MILCVEDDPAMFRVIRLAFAECHVPVSLYRAEDGEEALLILQQLGAHAQAPRPDIILLDLNLPKKSGLEVLISVKANPAWSAIPIVIFTSSSRDAEQVQCLAQGAADYIQKPLHFEGVMEAMRSVYARVSPKQ